MNSFDRRSIDKRTAEKALRYRDAQGVYSAEFEADALVAATIALEVAVDEFTARSYSIECKRSGYGYTSGSSTPRNDANLLRDLQYAIIDASTEVAAAMNDADVSLFDSSYAGSVIPVESRPAAAQAELRMLRAARKAQADANLSAPAHPYSPSTAPSVDGAGCLYRPQIGPGEWSLVTCKLPEYAHPHA